MNQLLEDVLLVGKSKPEKIQLNSTHLALISFFQQLAEETQKNGGSHHIINCVIRGDDSNAYLDEKLIHHIFLSNLPSNAIKYSPQDGKVDFNLTYEAHQATFEIKDCEIGIPAKDIKQLFISFHRGSNVKSIQVRN